MNLNRAFRSGNEQGFSLLECLLYISLLFVVLGFAAKVFFQSWDDSKALRRNADDIVRVLHAGDRWRSDVRTATGPLQLTDENGVEQCRVPTSAGNIVYTFSNGEVRRQAGAAGESVWLPNVKSSQMQPESRSNVKTWRWELELKTIKKDALFHPLFTFEAVTGGGTVQ